VLFWKQNIVALYNALLAPTPSAFIRIKGNSVDCDGGHKSIDELPFFWASERFLVVNAGNGRIALYSPKHRRFLAAQNGKAEASGYPVVNLDDRPRCNESFRAQTYAFNQQFIELYCDIEENTSSRKVHVIIQTYFQVVQIDGFEPAN
jgi:hypothetical protein